MKLEKFILMWLYLHYINQSNMDEIKAIENNLQKISMMLNDVATVLAKSDIPCRSVDIQHVGKALAEIFDIQQSLYEERPELMPEYLKQKSNSIDISRKYSRIKTQNQYFLAKNETKEALKLLTDFINSKPPNEFLNMANDEIVRIKKLFNIR